jgi:formate hydrogenlyase subunit 3/multisubunit Na+/H+ antiporter MnhD subunit
MSVLVIPLAAILMPLVLVPTILFMKHRHERRQWEHLERMRQMEERLPASPVQALGRARGVAAIGAGVPIVSVFTAWLTTISYQPAVFDESVAGIAWGSAAIISICAMFTGLLLARMHVRAVKDLESDTSQNAKPVYDPDAFDVVSRRG